MHRDGADIWVKGAAGAALALGLAAPLAVPPARGPVAVVGPPGDGLPAVARIVAAAGGAILAQGRFGNLLVAVSDAPGFARRLYAAGAWLVLDPRLAVGCGPDPGSDAPSRKD
ncbi:hypothetical protein [Methylobacterium sp. JK268]